MNTRRFFICAVVALTVAFSFSSTASAQSGPDDGPINTGRKAFQANLAVVNSLLGEAREEMGRRNGKQSTKKAAQAAIDAAIDLIGDANEAIAEAEKLSDPAAKAAAIAAAVALLDNGTVDVATPVDARDQVEIALQNLRSMRRGAPAPVPVPGPSSKLDPRCNDGAFAAAHPSICKNA